MKPGIRGFGAGLNWFAWHMRYVWYLWSWSCPGNRNNPPADPGFSGHIYSMAHCITYGTLHLNIICHTAEDKWYSGALHLSSVGDKSKIAHALQFLSSWLSWHQIVVHHFFFSIFPHLPLSWRCENRWECKWLCSFALGPKSALINISICLH